VLMDGPLQAALAPRRARSRARSRCRPGKRDQLRPIPGRCPPSARAARPRSRPLRPAPAGSARCSPTAAQPSQPRPRRTWDRRPRRPRRRTSNHKNKQPLSSSAPSFASAAVSPRARRRRPGNYLHRYGARASCPDTNSRPRSERQQAMARCRRDPDTRPRLSTGTGTSPQSWPSVCAGQHSHRHQTFCVWQSRAQRRMVAAGT
jgi:hypothetical protein